MMPMLPVVTYMYMGLATERGIEDGHNFSPRRDLYPIMHEIKRLRAARKLGDNGMRASDIEKPPTTEEEGPKRLRYENHGGRRVAVPINET